MRSMFTNTYTTTQDILWWQMEDAFSTKWCETIIRKVTLWTILGAVFCKCHTLCMLKIRLQISREKKIEHYPLSSLCIHFIYCWTCSCSTSNIRCRTINKFSKNYCTLLQARHVTFSTQTRDNHLHFLTCAFDSSRQTIG